MTKKYQLLIRMWVKQTDKLYDSAAEAYEAGRKVADEENLSVQEVEV